MGNSVRFAIPGDIASRTGGYVYDSRLIAELRGLGWRVEHLAWPASFPFPTENDRAAAAQSLAACPDGAVVLIDGLAFGALPELAEWEAQRLKLVALVHHPLALESGLSFEARRALILSERRALKCARAVIVTSDTTATGLAADYGIDRARIEVAKPGIDRPATARPPKPPDAVPHLLSVATVTPRKGFDVLIDALAGLADLEWTLTVAGSLTRSPETAAAVEKQLVDYGLTGRVTLLGEIDDPAPLYRSADIFVLASRYEGYGMAFAEALANGLPVVATNAGAIPEVVPPSAGLLVPADDPDALTSALRRILSDRELRDRLAGAVGVELPNWRATGALVASVLDSAQRHR